MDRPRGVLGPGGTTEGVYAAVRMAMGPMDAAPLDLTPNECLFLCDALPGVAVRVGDEPGLAYPSLRLKVFSALQDASPEKPAQVWFTESELWLICEVSKASVVYGSERVGFHLLKMASAALLKIAAYEAAPDVLGSQNIGEVYEAGKGKYADKLKKLKEEHDAERDARESSHKDGAGNATGDAPPV